MQRVMSSTMLFWKDESRTSSRTVSGVLWFLNFNNYDWELFHLFEKKVIYFNLLLPNLT